MDRAARTSPASPAIAPHAAAWPVVEPNRVAPNASRPAITAPASPMPEPSTPTSSASAPASQTILRGEAPLIRSSACSRRRRSAPAAPMTLVTSAARIAPGSPRNRNSSSAYSASLRAASSCAPRLSPTRAAPASRASRFLARAITSAKAAAGSGGSAEDSFTWYWMCTPAGRVPPGGVNARCHWAVGSSTTLSGGACGAAPGGTPTAWNSESAAGRSTIP
jgi:hypothetical protein